MDGLVQGKEIDLLAGRGGSESSLATERRISLTDIPVAARQATDISWSSSDSSWTRCLLLAPRLIGGMTPLVSK